MCEMALKLLVFFCLCTMEKFPSYRGQETSQHVISYSERPITLGDILPKNYNNFRPPMKNGKAALVQFRMYLLNIRAFDDSEMSFGADIFIQMFWVDERLIFPDWVNESKIVLNLDWLQKVWIPDTYFQDIIDSKVEKLITPNLYLWLHKNYTVSLFGRFNLQVSCEMKLKKFPHDTQKCQLKILSLSYSYDQVKMEWIDKDGFQMGPSIVLQQFNIINTSHYHGKRNLAFAEVSFLSADITFKRREGYFIINVYIPTILIVMMSMLTFWVPPDAVPARVTLGVTSLLTMITKQYQADMPNVSYIVALNVWLSCCIAFVFCSLLEYAIVIALLTKAKRREEETKTCTEVPKYDGKVRALYVRGYLKAHVTVPKKKGGITLFKVVHFIDHASRLLFPLVFILMVVIYWTSYCSS